MNIKSELFVLVAALLCWCCEKSVDDETSKTPPKEINAVPVSPQPVFPTDNLLCTDNNLIFKWSASSDANDDAVTYQIDVAKDNQFLEIVHSVIVSETNQEFLLEKGVARYWRVKAIDSNGAASDFSEMYSLYTEFEGLSNHLPFTPELIGPSDSANLEEGDVTLTWNASDIDENPLVFDVFFGVENPPTTLISENLQADTLTVGTAGSTDYYWQIIAKDDKGGSAVGQVWSFSVD